MFIKKSIFLLSLFFVLSVQASQIVPIRTTEKNGTTTQVFVFLDVDSSEKVTWMRETRVTGPDGNVIGEEWDGFSTQAEAEGRWSVIQENDDSDDSDEEERGMGARTKSSFYYPFPFEDEEDKIQPARPLLQPRELQKISLRHDQISSVAQKLQDDLILQFTGRMTPEEVVRLIEKNNFKNYDDVTLRKISQKISNALQDLDGLADVMYKVLKQQQNFTFRPKDTDEAKERYWKNYLWQYAQRYVSNDLAQALKDRFLYKKLQPNESLQYAKELYWNLMQDPTIDWLKDSKDSKKNSNLEAVTRIVRNYLQNSTAPNVVEIRKRLPFVTVEDNLQVRDDLNEIIDWTAKKIALPVNRASGNLGEKFEEQFFQQQQQMRKAIKDKLEGDMLERQQALAKK